MRSRVAHIRCHCIVYAAHKCLRIRRDATRLESASNFNLFDFNFIFQLEFQCVLPTRLSLTDFGDVHLHIFLHRVIRN